MNIRLGYAIVAVTFAFWCAGASAMTADELVSRNLQARGGADAMRAIKTLKSEGKLLFGGQFELTLTQFQKAPESIRSEASMQGLTAVQAWDGTEAWQISPFQGRKDPEKMTADDGKELADSASVCGNLLDWQQRGSKLAYLGTEDVDGTTAHKLKLTLKNGDVQTFFLDPDHFLEIRIVAQRSVRGTEVESVSDFGDYEKVDGVYFPFSVTTENKADGNRQQVTIDHAEANAPMADSLFTFPVASNGAVK